MFFYIFHFSRFLSDFVLNFSVFNLILIFSNFFHNYIGLVLANTFISFLYYFSIFNRFLLLLPDHFLLVPIFRTIYGLDVHLIVFS